MRYRIKKHINSYNRISYEIQKRSILGFWYNPDNVDANTTGFFDNLEDAEKCIESKIGMNYTAYIRKLKLEKLNSL